MITTGGTVGLAEWIIDDTCLVFFLSLDVTLELFWLLPDCRHCLQIITAKVHCIECRISSEFRFKLSLFKIYVWYQEIDFIASFQVLIHEADTVPAGSDHYFHTECPSVPKL